MACSKHVNILPVMQLTCANAIVNGLLNIHPENVALSFKHGEVQMSGKVADGSSQGTAIVDAEKRSQNINYGGMNLGIGGETVQARTLDSYNLTNISLIKIDIQGAETLAVYGGRDTIKRNMPAVVYELGLGITKDMKESMQVPPEVESFNITGKH